MGTTEGAGVEKQEEDSFEQPGKSWVVLEERSQGSIGLPLLLTVAKMRDCLKFAFSWSNVFETNKMFCAT